MVHLIENIITKDECEYLTKEFDIERKYEMSVDNKLTGTNTSYGFQPSFKFNTYLDKLKSKVLDYHYVDEILNVNTFVREYINTSKLEKHIDRKDIGITMSICIESTIDYDWPLCALINDKEHCFSTNVGDAVLLFNSDKIVHWRDTLNCKENQRVLQFFLHWKPLNYEGKKTKTLL